MRLMRLVLIWLVVAVVMAYCSMEIARELEEVMCEKQASGYAFKQELDCEQEKGDEG